MEQSRNRGFVGIIALLVVGLFMLQFFFNINVYGWLKSPEVLSVLVYIKRIILLVWELFIKIPAIFIWEQIVVSVIWKYTLTVWQYLTSWVDSN
jgi:hypothetical protein